MQLSEKYSIFPHSRQNLDDTEMLADNLKLRIFDYQYWVNMVSRLGFDSSVYQPPSGSGNPSLESLSQYIDSTQLELLRVFHLFDSDNDQKITESEVASGLRQQGIFTRQGSPEASTAFQELIDMISTPSIVGGIARHAHPPEFLTALRNLRLAAIVHDRQLIDQDLRINMHEYCGDQLYSACPMEHPVAFLFKPDTWASELFLNPHIEAHISNDTHLTGGASHHVRWLHVHEASNKVVLGLAVKYGLDPRFVLDVLTLWEEQAKVDQVSTYDMHYGVTANTTAATANSPFGYIPNLPNCVGVPSMDRPMWFFIVVPILRLSEHSRNSLRQYKAWRGNVMLQRSTSSERENSIVKESLDATPCVEIIIEHCNLAIFVSGIAKGGTAISFTSKWVELTKFNTTPLNPEGGCAMTDWFCKRRTNDISTGSSSAGGTINQTVIGSNNSGKWSTPADRVSDTPQMSMFNKVLAQIRNPNSRLRIGDSHTFSLKVLCDITADYLLIAEAYKACLLILRERTDKEKDNLNSKEVSRIRESIVQLSDLCGVVEPVASMADTFTTRKQWSGDAMLYVSDISSNVSRFLKTMSALEVRAKSIVEEYKQYSQDKTSALLNTVTWVTIVFGPGKFLTSLYGMNFQSMPELTWEYGYLVFWCLLIGVTVFTFVMYRRLRWT